MLTDEDGFGDFLSYPARGVEHSMPAGSMPHPQISAPINAGQGHPIAPVAAATVPLTNVTALAAKKPGTWFVCPVSRLLCFIVLSKGAMKSFVHIDNVMYVGICCSGRGQYDDEVFGPRTD